VLKQLPSIHHCAGAAVNTQGMALGTAEVNHRFEHPALLLADRLAPRWRWPSGWPWLATATTPE
jgi:hypothetical protein